MAVDGQRFMTKTQHYRKVTKPLLERKRRARMNLYLDELKDLIVDTMEAQGEHIAKLEKADILELTVNYLRTHKHEIAASVAQQQQQQHQTVGRFATGCGVVNVEKFRAGYTQAAHEVSRMFATVPGLDVKFGTKLMKHLGYQLKDLQHTLATPSTPAPAVHLENEKALNLEVIKRNASSPMPINLNVDQEQKIRRAYQQHQISQQKRCTKMEEMEKNANEADDDENGSECLWRPW